jgi:hypothetical protein
LRSSKRSLRFKLTINQRLLRIVNATVSRQCPGPPRRARGCLVLSQGCVAFGYLRWCYSPVLSTRDYGLRRRHAVLVWLEQVSGFMTGGISQSPSDTPGGDRARPALNLLLPAFSPVSDCFAWWLRRSASRTGLLFGWPLGLPLRCLQRFRPSIGHLGYSPEARRIYARRNSPVCGRLSTGCIG